MSWVTIRKATEEDIERLEARTLTFIKRHNLPVPVCDNESAQTKLDEYLECELEYYAYDKPSASRPYYLRKLYRRVIERALEPGAEGIAHGYIGYKGQ